MRKPTLLASQILSITLMMFSVTVLSAPRHTVNTQSSIQITLTEQKDSAIRLEARQAPLGQILKEIATKTGTIIHYSVLPETPVTATCVGADIAQVMDCLAAKQIGLVGHKAQKDKPAEFWLLGSSVGSCKALMISMPSMIKNATPLSPKNDETTQTDPTPRLSKQEQSDLLLGQLRSAETSEKKAEILANIGADGLIKDANVRKAIDDAILDADPNVRAQAVSALANLDKDNAKEVLSNALHDADSSVRMMAIDQSDDDAEILKQALADTDESVRNYATAKLEEIKKREDKHLAAEGL
jgi:HEAT repeats